MQPYDLVALKKILKLLLVEFINAGDPAPPLSLVQETTPRLGAFCADGFSSSRPVCHSGGSSASARRRASATPQVVSSPVVRSTAVASKLCSSDGGEGLDRVFRFLLRSFLQSLRAMM
jgi:hypothetical protein